nr:hypothetical protein HK105_001594 [Polyrhizophydium stewartii]
MDTSRLGPKPEWHRAFMVLSFIAHSHIIGIPKVDTVEPIIPEVIARPWFAIAKKLELKPVISYAAVELANWFLLDPEGPLDLSIADHQLPHDAQPADDTFVSNIAIQHTFSGVFDEAWFYLIPLGMEAVGAPSIKAMVDAQEAILRDDESAVAAALHIVTDCIDKMCVMLKRMYEKNDPHIFWSRIRNYSGGSKNNANLPNGLFFEGVTEIDADVNQCVPPPKGLVGTWRCYAGASAGQSPLIHSLDVGLGVHHASMPQKSSDSPATKAPAVNPMLEMREYLSAEQRAFFKALGEAPSIREYVSSLSSTSAAQIEFNNAIRALKSFRDIHIQITTVYIILQQKKEAASTGAMSPKGTVGTGGTDLVPFLRQTRQETIDALVKST